MQFTSDDESQWWAKPAARNNLAAGENRKSPKRQSNKHYHLQQASRIHSRLQNLRHATSKGHYFRPCWSIAEKQQLQRPTAGAANRGHFPRVRPSAPLTTARAGAERKGRLGEFNKQASQVALVTFSPALFPSADIRRVKIKRSGQAEEPHSLRVQPQKGSRGLKVNLVFGQR